LTVNCFQDTQDLRGGLEWRDQINQAIRKHDKLLLVCSRQAVYREQVVREILEAIDAERETGDKKFFPIRLDDHIISASMIEEAREKVRAGEWRENWVYYVCKYQIPDFSGWKDHDAYQAELQKLLRDLKSPGERG
jgi:TIR domain